MLAILPALLQKFNPFKKVIRLAVIYVEYDRQKNSESDRIFSLLQGYLATIANCRITYIRVDNKFEQLPLRNAEGEELFTVGGDNSFREFSGWQQGIKAFNTLHRPCDLVLLTNEMFLKPGPSFLQDYATVDLLQRALRHQSIIGRIDTVQQKYSLFGYDVSSWICTNCLLIPKKAIDALGTVVLVDDNIHDLLPRSYDPSHRLVPHSWTLDPQSGDFVLELELPAPAPTELRFVFYPQGPVADPPSPRALIQELLSNGRPLPHSGSGRGLFVDAQGILHAAPAFLLTLPAGELQPHHLRLKGRLIPQKNSNNPPEIRVYNDAKLFQSNAPLNLVYQRWIVEWLTERWHSRFEVNEQTWSLFKTKAAAIFNEALLTAKFKELGYPPESYGEIKYY